MPLVCDNDRTVDDSPDLVSRHPYLPDIQLHRSTRAGESLLLAVAVPVTGDELVAVGEWLIEHGREHTAPSER